MLHDLLDHLDIGLILAQSGTEGILLSFSFVTIQNKLKILRIFRCFGFIQYINL